MPVQGFWCSSTCLSFKTIGTCTQLFLTDKSVMVVTQSKKIILVWVRTFIHWRKSSAESPSSCCFLGFGVPFFAGFWIPWICTSKTTFSWWSRIAHFHACTFANSDAVGTSRIALQKGDPYYTFSLATPNAVKTNLPRKLKYYRGRKNNSLLSFSPIISQCRIPFCHTTLFSSTLTHKRNNILPCLDYSLEAFNICNIKGPIPEVLLGGKIENWKHIQCFEGILHKIM